MQLHDTKHCTDIADNIYGIMEVHPFQFTDMVEPVFCDMSGTTMHNVVPSTTMMLCDACKPSHATAMQACTRQPRTCVSGNTTVSANV